MPSSPSRRVRRVTAAAVVSALASAAIAATSTPATAAPATPVYLDTSYSFEARATDLVSRMSLPEKALQLQAIIGKETPAIPRLGVADYGYGNEAQHGVLLLNAYANPGPAGGGFEFAKATSFPTNFASSMSWDPSLVYQETSAIADEARGFVDPSLFGTGQNNLGMSASNYGSLTYWAPTVNLDRDPRWGRTDEGFGEDPHLAATMAGAFVNGMQGQTQDGQSTTGYLKVAATAKHFAMNNIEQVRYTSDSVAPDATIRNYYMGVFSSLIEKAHVAGLMSSYNSINGTPATADTWSLNTLAQRTFGFDGYITSDCNAVGTLYRNTTPAGPDNTTGHDWAPPGWATDHQGENATWTNARTGQIISGKSGAAAYALRAGVGLNCNGDEYQIQYLQEAIDAGVLSEGVVDAALIRIFTTRFKLGEFDPRNTVPYTAITKAQIESQAHRNLATRVAANSLVLLKNSTPSGAAAPVLPANIATVKNVVVLGDQAGKVTLGDYSGAPTQQISALAGLTARIKAAHPDATITYDAAGTSSTATTPAVFAPGTAAAIANADLVVVMVGTDGRTSGEGRDRANLQMPGNYRSLIQQTTAIGNPHTVLAIQSNGPVKIDDLAPSVPAILYSGPNGENQGVALAQVVFGDQNPSGHLNFTWFKDDSQLPAFTNYNLTPATTGGLGRTYQFFTGRPTYPFGYGLSYSSFRYGNATVSSPSITAGGTVTVSFDVTNVSRRPGATVAQVYAAPTSNVQGTDVPKQRLVGFQKTAVLNPGATQHVNIAVKATDLAMWDARQNKEVVYNGTYAMQVAANASSISATLPVAISGQAPVTVKTVTVQPEKLVYGVNETVDLTGKNRWIGDDTNGTADVIADDVVEATQSNDTFLNLRGQDVSYTSSNPRVATVDSSGRLVTRTRGVTTISVTVRGVTGSVAIAVR